MKIFQDAGHLFRVAAVFLVGLIAFLTLRSFLVSRSFGRYGHYRANAITEIAALPVRYAGHQVCEGCHADVLDVKSKGVHKSLAKPKNFPQVNAVEHSGGAACNTCHQPHSPAMNVGVTQ